MGIKERGREMCEKGDGRKERSRNGKEGWALFVKPKRGWAPLVGGSVRIVVGSFRIFLKGRGRVIIVEPLLLSPTIFTIDR